VGTLTNNTLPPEKNDVDTELTTTLSYSQITLSDNQFTGSNLPRNDEKKFISLKSQFSLYIPENQ